MGQHTFTAGDTMTKAFLASSAASCALLFTQPLAAQQAFSTDDLVRVEDLSEPTFAPDGEAVTYVVTGPGDGDSFQSDLWQVGWQANGQANDARALFATLDRDESSPAWSNDGATLYLAEGSSLYTYNPLTHAIKRIDNFKRKIEALEMGPDGYLLMGQNESKLIVIYDPLARRMVHGVNDDHHPEHHGSYRQSRIIDTINVSPFRDPEGLAWNVCNP